MQTRIPRPLTILLAAAMISLTSFKNGPYDPVSTPTNDNDSIKGFKSLLGIPNNVLMLAGRFELNPKVVPFVEDFLPRVSAKYENMKVWGKPYFMLYEKTLSDYGLPVELEYLSVIESDLQPYAISVKGAVGPWQFMDFEAKRFGLKITAKVDERTDFKKSTVAAAKLLKELYDNFDDWLLVIAAYNGGSGCVTRAIQKAGTSDFWALQSYLPEETRNHVKKYIATHYYFEGSGGWTTLTASETAGKKLMIAELQRKLDSLNASANIGSLEIVGKYNSAAVSKYLSLDINEFDKLNPLFDKTLSAGDFYTIRLPLDKLEIFKSKRQYILQESVQMLLSGAAAATINSNASADR
jgi:membrane-bound lytic murein transglycosylase D